MCSKFVTTSRVNHQDSSGDLSTKKEKLILTTSSKIYEENGYMHD